MVVRLTNPTKLPAAVRMFCECGLDAVLHLPDNYLFECPVIDLTPGETKTLSFSKNNP
jgi:hypothetical protein